MLPRLVFLLTLSVALAPAAAGQPALSAATAPSAPGRLLPLVAEHRYMVTASVRVLIFWYARDSVGEATLRWRADEGGRRAFELLIGSEPKKARGVNRWGYIAEEVGPNRAALLGVMKESDESTLAEAQNREDQREQQFRYKAIRTEVAGSTGRTGTVRIVLPSDPTYRDVDLVLAQLPPSPPAPKEYVLEPGAKPGYLSTLQDAVDETVAWFGRGHPAADSPVGRSVRYIYNGTLYDLVLRSTKPVPSARYRGRTFSDLIDSEFAITNKTTGEVTRFEIQYPRTGMRAGVPVHGVFRPRWWFEVQITMDDGDRKAAPVSITQPRAGCDPPRPPVASGR